MGQCVSADETAKYSLNVMKQALKIFKDKVDSSMIDLQSVQKGPKRQLKKIQALKAMIRSLEKQVGNFYQHFKQQKCPPNFIYSINTMNSLLDDVWRDHNRSLCTVKKLQQRVEFWSNAAKNVKQSQESLRNNTQFGGPQTDTKQNNSYNIDKMAEIDALNIKIDSLNTIIKKNQQISVEYEARFKKEQQNLIQQKTKQLKDIEELSFQLGLANSQLTNKTNISQKGNQYEKRIAAHEVKLAQLQKRIKEKAQKEDLLNRKIQTIEEEKNTLLKRIQQNQATPTPSDYNIYDPDEQLKADNQSLRNRLRQAKNELANLQKQQLKQNKIANNPLLRSSESDAQQEILKLKASKQNFQDRIRMNDLTILSLRSEISKLKNEVQSLNQVKKQNELKLLQSKELIESIKAARNDYEQANLSSQVLNTRFRQEEILKKTHQITLLQTQLKNTQQSLRSKDEEYQHNLNKLQSLENNNQRLSAELKKTQNTLSNTNTIKIKQDNQIITLNQSLTLKERELKQLNSQLKALRQEIAVANSQWEQKIRREQIKIRQNEQTQRKLLLELENCKITIENYQNDRSKSEQALRDYEHLQSKLSQLTNENFSLKKSLQDSLNTFKKDKQSLEDTFKIKQAETQKIFSKQKISLLQQIQQLKKGNDQKSQQLYQLNKNLNQKCSQVQFIKAEKLTPSICYTQYFCGHILNYHTKEYTQWFVQNLQKSVKRSIRATYPVYRFDRDNKNSFHNYVDNKPQIVLIVKIANGQVIAGYSEPPFRPKTNIDFRPGFMFAFRNKKIFTVKKEPTTKFNKTQPKPITYDEYFLMWGNSDIRIKSGSDEFFSGYATANCCYEERGNENSVVDDLILQDDRQTTLVDYELFQVEFEDDRF